MILSHLLRASSQPTQKLEPTISWRFSRGTSSILVLSFILWLALCAGKMNQISRCYWLPKRARWSYLARSGLSAVSQSHIIYPLLTKFFRTRWLDIALVLFCCEFMVLESISVHKNARKELGQYPAILTSHLVNNRYILLFRNSLVGVDNESV